MEKDKAAVRNAATMIVVRDRSIEPKILMGQRRSNAAFMPNKFVFPGGAVDLNDKYIPLVNSIPEPCLGRLADASDPDLVHSLCVAAIRELFEETGQILGVKKERQGHIPKDWINFAAAGYVPDASGLQFVFRAITPPGRPRRFDARFFFVDADLLMNNIDDFSEACDELSHLQWVALDEVRKFDLPFITEVVLAEIGARIKDISPPASVPFFKSGDEESEFVRLKGPKKTSLEKS